MNLINFGVYELIMPEKEKIIEEDKEHFYLYGTEHKENRVRTTINKSMLGMHFMFLHPREISLGVVPLLFYGRGKSYFCPRSTLKFIRIEYDVRNIVEFLGNNGAVDKLPSKLFRPDLFELARTVPTDCKLFKNRTMWERKNYPIMKNLYGLEMKKILATLAGSQSLVCPKCGLHTEYKYVSDTKNVAFRNGTMYFSCVICGARAKLVLSMEGAAYPGGDMFGTALVQ